MEKYNICFLTDNMPKSWYEHVYKLKDLTFCNIWIDDFINKEMLNLIEKKIMIPFSIVSTKSLLDSHDINKKNAVHLCSSLDVINLFDNKKLFEKFMNNNFKELIPKSYHSIPTQFPCVLKKPYGLAANGVYLAHNINEYNEIIKNNLDKTEFICQEYIKSDKHIVGHFLLKNGEILGKKYFYMKLPDEYIILRGRLRKYDECYLSNEHEKIISEIFAHPNIIYNGFACIDFTIVDNKIKIYEINPRIGGSCVCDYTCMEYFMNLLNNF